LEKLVQKKRKGKEAIIEKVSNIINGHQQFYIQTIFQNVKSHNRVWITYLFYRLLTNDQKKTFSKLVIGQANGEKKQKQKRKWESEKEEQIQIDEELRQKRIAEFEAKKEEIKQNAKKRKEKREKKLATVYNEHADPENYQIHQNYVNNNVYKTRDKASIQSFLYKYTDGAVKRMQLIPKIQLSNVHDSSEFRYVPPCGIYRFYDINTGMAYIGQSKDVWERITKHLEESTLSFSKSPFQQHIRNCGMDDIRLEILWYGKDLLDENIRLHFESYFINEYDTTNPLKGWNKVQPYRFKFNLADSKRIVEAHI